MFIARRRVLGLALGAGFLSRLSAKPRACQRTYRVHATVTLLSVPLVSKTNVGSGYILIEQAEATGAACTTAIQLGAGSWPEAARGLNRLGFIQEVVTERHPEVGTDWHKRGPLECSYFAFMTTSQEKSLDQAKKALETQGDSVPYAAAQGSGREGQFVSRLSRINFPSRLTWRDCPRLVDEVRAAVSAEAPAQRVEKTLATDESAPATFLYAVRNAILDPASTTSGSLIYNGKEYQLRTTKEPDTTACAHFAGRKLLREGGRVMRLNAELEEQATGRRTPFKVWYEAGSEHLPPLRFEYQAKSFLRLTFEFDSTASCPAAVPSLND
jgi:hypothetical protein